MVKDVGERVDFFGSEGVRSTTDVDGWPRPSRIIFRENLANFRDLDYHFVSAVVFKGGDELTFAIQCANPNPGPNCTPAAYFSGFIRSV